MMVESNPQEDGLRQQSILKESEIPTSPASFITSSARKRKPGQLSNQDSKRRVDCRKPSQKKDDEEYDLERRIEFDTEDVSQAQDEVMLSSQAGDVKKRSIASKSGSLFSPSFGYVQKRGNEVINQQHTLPVDVSSTIQHSSGHASTSKSDDLATMPLVSLDAECSRQNSSESSLSAQRICICDGDSESELVPELKQSDLDIEEEEDYDDVDFDPFVFIKRLPSLHECIAPHTKYLLPRRTRHSRFRKTLVLDLDETLVHSSLDGDGIPDFTFNVHIGPISHVVAVRKRPHLQVFLETVALQYEVVVFTASQQVYAEQLLDVLDPTRRLIKHRIYRDSCVFWEGNYLKDLTSLGRDLAHTLIIDNSPQAFGFQLDNGVPILSWYDDDQDTELLKLLPFLEELVDSDDVRPIIAQRFGLRKLVHAAPSLM